MNGLKSLFIGMRSYQGTPGERGESQRTPIAGIADIARHRRDRKTETLALMTVIISNRFDQR
jgi:hypothetical protein